MTKSNKTRTHSRRQTVAISVSVIFVITFAIGGSGDTAMATPVIDGILGDNDNYTSYDVTFSVEKTSTTVSGGKLWYYTDAATNDLYLLFALPKDLVDNSYGDNSVGWGKNVAPSGKNHNFKDLTGSDKAQFVFTDGSGNSVLDITVDYFSEFRKGRGRKSEIIGYGTNGVSGSDATVDFGSADWVLGVGTSLDYNFNTLGHVLTEDSPGADDYYNITDSQYSDWVFDVVYELKISGEAFGESGFGEVSMPIIHASPNKIGKNRVYPNIGYVTEIPEPATLCMLGIGAIGLILRKRR